MVKKYIPRQGDIVMLNFNPQIGREQSGLRPALVISATAYNRKVGLALFCPITKHIKGYPFEVTLPLDLKTKGVILGDHVKNLDWQKRSAHFIEKSPPSVFAELIAKLKILLEDGK